MTEWKATSYEVVDTLCDEYYFAGPSWNAQKAKRFILRTKPHKKIIESSYYVHLNKNGEPINVAFEPSTSFGCPVGCLFCASGQLFPIKSLSADEIFQQVDVLIRTYQHDLPDFKTVRQDVFYAGIGEPTLQAKTIIDASEKILAHYPHMTFKMSSMVAKPKELLRFSNSEIKFRSVQVGIPHWDEAKIKYLYHKCSKYSLNEVLNAVKTLLAENPHTRLKINYIGIKGLNDSVDDLQRTLDVIDTKLLGKYELKLSCLNPTEFGKQNELQTLSQTELLGLKQSIADRPIDTVYVFGPMSTEKLGCGQLAGQYSEAK